MLNVIIISGYGLNCEEETSFAFSTAGDNTTVDIIHINDLIQQPILLRKYQIMAIPGGFSYGDHTGAGNAFAWYLKKNLIDEIHKFRTADKLIIGICNGCQVLVRIFPDDFPVELSPNNSGKYQCEWVDVTASGNSVWCKGVTKMRIPIAHGEGKFKMKNKSVNIALSYVDNPNGSELNTAALSSSDGRVLAIMPHPERAILFTQQDRWPFMKEEFLRKQMSVPKSGDGMAIFRNAIDYFK